MKTTWQNYVIESEWKGEKSSIWGRGDDSSRHHVVTITNMDTDESIKFNFWTSIARPEFEDEKDLLEAVSCFLGDAQWGQLDFYEYCREQGYDIPDGMRKSWKGCNKARKKAEKFFGEEEWHDVLDKLNEDLY